MSVSLGLEEAETMQASTLEFCVCGCVRLRLVSFKPGLGKLKLWKQQLLTVSGWVGGGGLCHMIRPGPGEANAVGAAALGGQVGLRLVSIRPGPGEAEVVQTAEVGRWDKMSCEHQTSYRRS